MLKEGQLADFMRNMNAILKEIFCRRQYLGWPGALLARLLKYDKNRLYNPGRKIASV